MINHLDLLIVGAGPAGLSAAVAARSCGLDVGIVDEQGAAGGQIFRNLHLSYGRELVDAHDRELGLNLLHSFHECGACFFAQTSVWGVDKNTVFCKNNGKTEKITATKILFTVGGMERPVPFKGWTLPGVMTAGAAEIILRSGGHINAAKEPVVLAGNGPLLLSLAMHLLDEGIPIAAWLDTGRFSHKLGSMMHMGSAFGDIPYLKKGMRMALRILKNRVPLIQGVKQIEAMGDISLDKIRYQKNNKWHELSTHTLIRHENIIPRIQVASALGVEMAWDSVQRYWYPKTDLYGRTNLNNIYMTGDGAFVHGGEASMGKGSLAGIAIANDIGVISADEAEVRCAKYLKEMQKTCKARNYLRYVFTPNTDVYHVPDETIICRCECVTAKEIRQAVREGFHSPDEVKRFTRCGMGPCQGRMCGNALAEIIAQEQGIAVDEVGMLKNRQPFSPVSLGDYCDLHAPQ